MEYAISLLEHYHLNILNNHPWNQKAQELLQKTELEGGYPDHLYILQLMQWGLDNLPEFKEMEVPMIQPPQTTSRVDLFNELNGLILQDPEGSDGVPDRDPLGTRDSEPYPEVREVSEGAVTRTRRGDVANEPIRTDQVVDSSPDGLELPIY